MRTTECYPGETMLLLGWVLMGRMAFPCSKHCVRSPVQKRVQVLINYWDCLKRHLGKCTGGRFTAPPCSKLGCSEKREHSSQPPRGEKEKVRKERTEEEDDEKVKILRFHNPSKKSLNIVQERTTFPTSLTFQTKGTVHHDLHGQWGSLAGCQQNLQFESGWNFVWGHSDVACSTSYSVKSSIMKICLSRERIWWYSKQQVIFRWGLRGWQLSSVEYLSNSNGL